MEIMETWWLVVRDGLASVCLSLHGAIEDAEYRRHNDWPTDSTAAAISR